MDNAHLLSGEATALKLYKSAWMYVVFCCQRDFYQAVAVNGSMYQPHML